jgi:hypothetical protein
VGLGIFLTLFPPIKNLARLQNVAEIKVHNNQQISISKAKGFIRYQIKGTEKTEYASFVIPQWVNKKKVNKELYLGRLINK